MKNTEQYQLKNAISMKYKEFLELMEKLGFLMDYDNGLYLADNSRTDEDAMNALSEYFDVKVTSVHVDDHADMGVWIVYKDKEASAETSDVFGLDYAREEKPQIKEIKSFGDIWAALRSCSTIHQLVGTVESLPRWSGDWEFKLTDHSVIVVNTYFDTMLDETSEEEEEFEFEDLVGGDTAGFWPYIINVDRYDGEFEPLASAPTERSAKQLASDLVEYFGDEVSATEVKYSCENPDDPNPLNDTIIAKFGC